MSDKDQALSTLAALEAVVDLEVLPVLVPEWKATVYLRTLPADEGLVLNDQMQALPKEKNSEAMFLLLGACMSDAKGNPLARTDEEKTRMRASLGGRQTKPLLQLQRAALKLQGWLPDAEGAAKNA